LGRILRSPIAYAAAVIDAYGFQRLSLCESAKSEMPRIILHGKLFINTAGDSRIWLVRLLSYYQAISRNPEEHTQEEAHIQKEEASGNASCNSPGAPRETPPQLIVI